MQSKLTAIGIFKREDLSLCLNLPVDAYERYPLGKPVIAEIIHIESAENSRKLAMMIGVKDPEKACFISNSEMSEKITADLQRFIHACQPENADAWVDLTVLAGAGFDFIYEPSYET